LTASSERINLILLWAGSLRVEFSVVSALSNLFVATTILTEE
jgi:hypothetical protein